MRLLKYLNPFYWLPEDPVTRCGIYCISVYKNPKDDPYFLFCEWDDRGTTRGSYAQKYVTLERYIECGIEQLKLLQSRWPVGSFEYELGDLYLDIWPKVVPYYWEGL